MSDISHPEQLPQVAGRMEMTHAAFQRACQVGLLHLQDSPLTDNALVQLLCEAVRCSRECCEIATIRPDAARIKQLEQKLRESEAACAAMRQVVEASDCFCRVKDERFKCFRCKAMGLFSSKSDEQEDQRRERMRALLEKMPQNELNLIALLELLSSQGAGTCDPVVEMEFARRASALGWEQRRFD